MPIHMIIGKLTLKFLIYYGSELYLNLTVTISFK